MMLQTSLAGGDMIDIKTVFPMVAKGVKAAFPQATDEQIVQRIQGFSAKHPDVDNKIFAGVFLKTLGQPKISKLFDKKKTGLQGYLQGQGAKQ